jgi:phosphoglycolate phosphatase
MDGTLLDSSYALTCSVNHVREYLGLEAVSKEYLEYYINEPNQNLAQIFYATKEYNPIHKEMFKEHYLKNANLHVKPYTGAYELLKNLKNAGFKLSIATNASDFFAINMLKAQNMLNFFECIVGANMVKNPKPKPDMIYKACKLTSTKLKNSVLIGDSLKDEGAAKNAKIDFLFAKWGYGTSKSPTYTFDNLSELENFLLKHTN